MTEADGHVQLAIAHLWAMKQEYLDSGLRTSIKKARIRSLDAKISALKDIRADLSAYPWSEDWKQHGD
ncbi:MAG: hypothetical protein JWR85_4054 [Marmoricola sp.]|nr:hypothetical protein [Marmoricola sp.]